MPAVLLLAHIPPADAVGVRARLSTSLHLGETLHVHGVLLGAWPRGQTLTVDAAGHVHPGPGQPPVGSAGLDRVAVLGVAPSLELLRVLIETQTENRPPLRETPLVARDGSPPGEQPGAAGGEHRRSGEPPQQKGAEVPPLPDQIDSKTPKAVGDRVRARVLGAPMILDRDGQQLMDIMEKIWPDATTRRAAQRLSTEVANLRRTVRTALGRTNDRTPETNAVINTGSFYRLNHELLDVDAWQLTDLIATARNTSDAGRRIEHLRAAIDVYRGQLADGRDYPWSDVTRHQLQREAIRAHLHLAELLARPDQSGNARQAGLAEAARLIGQAADLDPVSEDLAQRSIRAHATTGDADAVRNRLRVLRAALNEIDQEPTGDTLALAANAPFVRRPEVGGARST